MIAASNSKRSDWGVGRLVMLKRAVCTGLICEVAFCPRLWTSDRGFPTVPALRFLPQLSNGISIGLTLLMIVGLIAVAVLRRPGLVAWTPPLFGFLLVLFDINRLQPWMYEYSFMLVALGVTDWDSPDSRRSRSAWGACALIVVSVYFWSGLQKLNLLFAHDIFPFLMKPLGQVVARDLQPVWFLAPAVEIAAGLLLLIPCTRKLGLILCVAMHAFLLAVLGPLAQNYNSTVWPWNFWMATLAVILFLRNDSQVLPSAWQGWAGRLVLLLFGLFPALNFAGYWDGFISDSYYSGRLRDGWLYFDQSGMNHLNPRYRADAGSFVEESRGVYRLDITQWAMSTMNVPPYAEPRVYADLLERLVGEGVPRSGMVLMVRDADSISSSARKYSRWPPPN